MMYIFIINFNIMIILEKKSNTVRTTLYLTENNKKWLETQPRGQRTQIVNEAIKRLKSEQIMQEKKDELLNTLENLPLYATHGVSPKELLNSERDRKCKS